MEPVAPRVSVRVCERRVWADWQTFFSRTRQQGDAAATIDRPESNLASLKYYDGVNGQTDVRAKEFEEIRGKTQRALIEFLRTELGLGSAFVSSATLARDAGHSDHFSQAESNAIKVVETVRRYMAQVLDARVRTEISELADKLERSISAL